MLNFIYIHKKDITSNPHRGSVDMHMAPQTNFTLQIMAHI